MRQLDLRERQSFVRDQGLRPTCLACAATSGHEYLRSDGHYLSAEYLHWTCTRSDGISCKGVSMASAVEALVDVGQPYEELWPYEQGVAALAIDYGPPRRIPAEACFRVKRGAEIRPIVEEMRHHIKEGSAVLIGLRIFYSFHTSAGGRITMPESTDASCGRHVVLLVGYDDDAQHFIFKNSWGTDWGERGYGFLPYSYLKGHALAACIFSNTGVK